MYFKKAALLLVLICLSVTASWAQQRTWSLSMGGMLETTKLLNTEKETLGRGEYSNPIRPSLGLLVGAGWQKKKLSLQFSVALKKNVVRAVHNFEYNNGTGIYRTHVFQQEGFFAVEPIITVGYIVPAKNDHHWQFGLLAGFAFNNKTTNVQSTESGSTLNDTVSFGLYTVGGDDLYHVITPEVGASIEFHQRFKKGKKRNGVWHTKQVGPYTAH